MSALGQKRRPLRLTAARRLPLRPESDRDRVAVQFVAKGQRPTSEHYGAGAGMGRMLETFQPAGVLTRT
jgi:hypothetical protein